MNAFLGEKISVCLLTYNHADLIDSTLESILHQTVADYEIIVSDDCSSDGTWEKILGRSVGDRRIKPIRTPQNLGMAANANFAVSHSNRPYVALLHHDDLYRSDLLERWSAALERCVDGAFVFNPYGVYQSDLVYGESMPGECIDGKWLLEHYLFARWGCLVRGTAMVRRECWQAVGGMRTEYGLLADVDLWMRLAMRWRVGYVNEPVITIRQARPAGYPETYTGTARAFWARQRILYEIHANNRLAYFKRNTLRGRALWWFFRWKLARETTKWLVYAIVKRKPEIITTSPESVTQYDLWPIKVFRSVLQRFHSGLRSLLTR